MRRFWAAASAGVALVACSGGGGAGAPLPPRPPTVEVTMQEYRFQYDPAIPPGRVVFRLRNAGRDVHELRLLALPEDLPPIDAQLHGSQRRFINPFVEIPDLDRGKTATFAADLARGQRYAFVCFNRDPQGEVHALKGMNSEFRAGGPSAEPAQPSAQQSSGARP